MREWGGGETDGWVIRLVSGQRMNVWMGGYVDERMHVWMYS